MSFTVTDLMERLNDIFGGEDYGLVTKRDILEPTPDFVQRFIPAFLQEFEYSDQMLAQNHSCLDLLAGDLHLSNDITDTLPLDILVVAVQRFLHRIEYKDIHFGILDIVEPDSKVGSTCLMLS